MSIDINSISLDQLNTNINIASDKTSDVEKNTIFEQFYNAAVDMYGQTNELQIQADNFQLDFAAGKTDDLAGMVIAQKKSETALQFTALITSKVLESYKQILQIQL